CFPALFFPTTIFLFNPGSNEKPPPPAPCGVSFSPAVPVHLPSTNLSFLHAESPVLSGTLCATRGRTPHIIALRIAVLFIVISLLRVYPTAPRFRPARVLLALS